MKKLFAFICLGLTISAQAQEKKHEIKWNLANTIVAGSVELGYEYHFAEHQSVGAELLINDNYNMGFGRQIKDFNTNSLQLSYNYYTGNANDEFVISPFMKFRNGDYQKTAETPEVNMNSFILGVGAGYKWNLNNTFVFGPYASIGRNFSEEVNDEFSTPVEFWLGFGVGYRF